MLQAGKTSLVKALVSASSSTKHIKLRDRSAALDISTQKLPLPGSQECDTIHCRLWDFGGHEVFYLSHTMHFTGRCLYLLTWSPVKHVDDEGKFDEVPIDEITAPLKKWIRILALHAPESSVVLVGTHSSCATAKPFDEMQAMVRVVVSDEACAMAKHAQREAKQLHLTRKRIEAELVLAVEGMLPLLSDHHLHLLPKLEEKTVGSLISFCKQLQGQEMLHSSVRRRVTDMHSIVSRYERTIERLQLLYGIRNGLPPPEVYSEELVIKLDVLDAFGVDSVENPASIHNLKTGLNALLRKSSIDLSTGKSKAAFPYIGELQPRWYNDAFKAISLQSRTGEFIWGSSILSLDKACTRVAKVPSISRHTRSSVESCLKFHHLLGNLFVFNDHFLRDPALLIELVKPMVHYDVSQISERFFKDGVEAVDHEGDLRTLHANAELSLGLLNCFKAWSSSSPSHRQGVEDFLLFLKGCHMVCDIPGQKDKWLVSARLANQPTPLAVEVIHKSASYNAFYLVPLNHVGFMAQFACAIRSRQPQGLAIKVDCGSNRDFDAVCIYSETAGDESSLSSPSSSPACRGCCISITNVPDSIEIARVDSSRFRTSSEHGIANGQRIAFIGDGVPSEIKKMCAYVAVVAAGARDYFQVSSLEGGDRVIQVSDVERCTFCVVRLKRDQDPADLALQLPARQRHLSFEDRFGAVLRISGNDMGFFTFAVQLADQLMASGTFSSRYQCWVPCIGAASVLWRSFHDNLDDAFSAEQPPGTRSLVLPESFSSAMRDYRKLTSLHSALQLRPLEVAVHQGKVPRKHLFSQSPCFERHRLFISCSYDDDGTLPFSQHFKNRLQDQALLSCWYQHEGSDQEVADAMRQAAAIIIFLSPQYLLQDRCLKQLALAVKLCGGKSKKLHVVCTHPAVSRRSRVELVKRVSDGQKCCIFAKEGAAYAAYEVSKAFSDVLQQLNERESQENSDQWMRFTCWNSCEKQWVEDHLSADCELWSMIDAYATQNFKQTDFEQTSSSPAGLDADRSFAPTKKLNFGNETIVAACQELYPKSVDLFGLENLPSVLELASLGLSDREIVDHADPDSTPLDASASSALNVAFAVSGVDFADARYMFHVIQANLQGVLEESKCFNDWIKSPLPAKKVVCRGEGTDDVMLFHALLLSSRDTGFIRKPTKDSVWSDFTFTHGGDKELKLCAQKLRSKIAEDERHGVQEKRFDFDIEVLKVQQLYADVTWFLVSDNDLKSSSISTGGTLQSKDGKV